MATTAYSKVIASFPSAVTKAEISTCVSVFCGFPCLAQASWAPHRTPKCLLVFLAAVGHLALHRLRLQAQGNTGCTLWAHLFSEEHWAQSLTCSQLLQVLHSTCVHTAMEQSAAHCSWGSGRLSPPVIWAPGSLRRPGPGGHSTEHGGPMCVRTQASPVWGCKMDIN